jgi:hypothetical protein
MYHSGLWGTAVDGYGSERVHPSPWADGLVGLEHYEVCAFGNPRQFKQWVYEIEWRKAMQANGGELLLISAPKESTRIGGRQVLIDSTCTQTLYRFPVDVFDNPVQSAMFYHLLEARHEQFAIVD